MFRCLRHCYTWKIVIKAGGDGEVILRESRIVDACDGNEDV